METKVTLQITDDWSEDIFLVREWNEWQHADKCIIKNRWLTSNLFQFGSHGERYEDSHKQALDFLQEHSDKFRDWIISAEARQRYEG